jgi:RNA polymerase sigma-70 factor (ECF subfamily)
MRTWLHQIATNVCLRFLEQRERRALPSGLGGPSPDWLSGARPAPAETRWVSPLPVDPADAAGARQKTRLAFVAALQHLPARQRAALILRDVAELPADEVAEILGTTTIAVNSALLRARERISREAPDPDEMREPGAEVARYADAFERADITALAAVLRDDVILEMPPHATWFAGREAVLGFLATHVLTEPRFAVRAVTPTANGQPTLALYSHGEAHALQVLDVDRGGIRRIHIFLMPELLTMFGQPVNLAAEPDLHRYDS